MIEKLPIVDILDELEKNGQSVPYKRETAMPDQRQLIWIPLFWGSLWGLVEATLGHVLHQMSIPGMAGYMMFPVGMFFMVQSFRHSGKLSILFLTAFVAANIKLIDLFLSAHDPFAVINPAVAILCESLAVGLFLKLRDSRKILGRLYLILILVLVWRSLYGILILSLGFIFQAQNFSTRGSATVIEFFLIESLINTILIYAFFQKQNLNTISRSFLLRTPGLKESNVLQHIISHPALITIPLAAVAIAVEFFIT